jgi:hypothetical protein
MAEPALAYISAGLFAHIVPWRSVADGEYVALCGISRRAIEWHLAGTEADVKANNRNLCPVCVKVREL